MKNLEIFLTRDSNSKECSQGLLEVEGVVYHTLEDPIRDEKIKSVTAIPEGRYELKIRQAASPMTTKYQKKYHWFKYHIQLMDVPNYEYVYIHIGNYAKDSDGCVLLGLGRATDMVTNSTKAFKKFYEKIYTMLESGDRVFINIENCLKNV